MGVPKFFRYISERYPCLSEIVREYQLPEFDNLYLDMNGIIHICSHPDDGDPHFRITEEKIFRDIFHYIESLFRMIQPQKLFFMAVDGVAPRAKMNQQRGRRFRSAKEAEDLEAKARERGEELPSAERFDSNCITPGTEFMTRLHAQLKYFVTFKISTDKLWQKCKVILSGHETPGEGEHKIMDYIRYMKSQPGYNPNTRHCLYGLDADLIMLGLCTHEPHFSLLREEVKYGKKNSQKRIPTPEETTFYLLHLSLMREYLDLEFQKLKTTLPFSYDLEHIIDDWVLMGFLVGNDFIPHLPDLHINKGALPILYKTYIDVLPTLGGYINEGGTLRLDRFQKYMEKLAAFDFEQFKEVSADLRFLEAKTGRKSGGKERHSYKNNEEPMSPPKNKDLAALIAATDEMVEGSEEDEDADSDEDEEDGISFAEFCAHKKNYYVEKLEYEQVTPEVLRSQGEGYVRAIQWNLNYYYNGCCSWSWFYPHHYAPYISDIKNFSNVKLEYDLGKPFLPFQQLLGVLPAASKKLLPTAYHDLMEDDESPIIDFYPTEFKTDLNGKKQDWEAVVLIPFIDQESLLQAMEPKEQDLTEEEKSRNRHGPMQVYTYTPENMGSYLAPDFFPALANHHAHLENVPREKLFVEKNALVKGLCPGVLLDVHYPGFPTLKHIPFTAALEKAKVKVFESNSQGHNMILTILPQGHPDVSEVAIQLLGKNIFVNWPHLLEARVMAVSSQRVRFLLKEDNKSIISEELDKVQQDRWTLSKLGIEERYRSRMGINVGKTEILVYACSIEDMKLVVSEDKMHYEKQWSKLPIAYALQTTRTSIAVHEPAMGLTLSMEQVYPPGTVVFVLDLPHYGGKGTVVEGGKNQRIKVNLVTEKEPPLEKLKYKLRKISPQYSPANALAQRLGITSHLLSRITGTIFVLSGDTQETEQKPYRLNIGLNLKFNKRNEEVCGYTKRDKSSGYWMYSFKAEEEVRHYMNKHPEVFDYLSRCSGSEDVHEKDLYPENTASKIADLKSWLKERSSMTAERQACGAQVLEEEVVLALEKMVDDFLKNEFSSTPITLNSKVSNLYVPKPKLGQAPDPKAEHELFDRIINVRESHTVPLGAKGTIIGIHDEEIGRQAMYDILFDKEFTGGLKLRCSPHRGYRLPGQAFINISFGVCRSDSKALGKPTAVVEPSGTEEDVSIGNNNHGHNSAFASWRNKPNYESGNSPINPPEQKNRWQNSPSKARYNQQNNLCHHSAPQQLSNEYFAIFTQLQKAGPNNKMQMGSKAPGKQTADPSNALKKMLKIADDATKKYPTPAENRVPVNISPSQSYCMQLLSLHQRLGMKLPRYLYSDTKDGSIICTVICANNKEYQGTPSFANDPAAESAARIALQCLAMEEQRGFGNPAQSSFQRLPLYMNNSPRPGPPYGTPNRLTGSWVREPAQPSTLPQPPTNWYQNQGMSSFQQDWRAGAGIRPSNSTFFPPSPQYKHSPHNQLMQHNQHGQYNNQIPNMWQQKPHFIPLQAETRIRQQPMSRDRHPEHPRHVPQNVVREQTPSRALPSGGNNSGRNSTRPPRTRIAANFAKPLSFDSPPDDTQ